MKLFVTGFVGALALLSPVVHAQWSLNGTSVFYNAGNVGIGTSAPAFPLEVRSVGQRAIFALSSAATGANFAILGQAQSTTGRGIFGLAGNVNGANYGVFGQTNSTIGYAVYGLANAAAGANYAVYGKTNSATGYAGYFAGGRNYFQNNVGIGVPAPVAKLDVLQPNTNVGVMALNVKNASSRILTAYGNGALLMGPTDSIAGVSIGADNNTGATVILGYQTGNVNTPRIRMNNTTLTLNGDVGIGVYPAYQLHLSQNSAAKPTANTWTVASDRRLKKNIHTIANALDQLMQLRGVTYQWIDPDTQGGMTGTYTGFIAQEVEEVFPEWVDEDNEGMKRVTVIGFEGLTVEALRQLREEKNREIADLQRQNAAHQQTIDAMQERLIELEKKLTRLQNTAH